MDPFDEVERMALNADTGDTSPSCDEPSSIDIQRWQNLFSYSHNEAVEKLKQHRADLSRPRISANLWASLQDLPEYKGFDAEAYEHKIQLLAKQPAKLTCQQSNNPSLPQTSTKPANYIFLMEGALTNPEDIKNALGSTTSPDIRNGVSEIGEAHFCRVDAAGKQLIESWLSQQRIAHRPTFIRESLAAKQLDPHSIYPTLGSDATLPQYRPTGVDDQFCPAQDQYPVWYFFYGSLMDPGVLSTQLGHSGDVGADLVPANVRGGVIKSWAGRYRALVDGTEADIVHGRAFEVRSAEQEEALRHYETSRYEVVRCAIAFERGETVMGCTFCFINAEELS